MLTLRETWHPRRALAYIYPDMTNQPTREQINCGESGKMHSFIKHQCRRCGYTGTAVTDHDEYFEEKGRFYSPEVCG